MENLENLKFRKDVIKQGDLLYHLCEGSAEPDKAKGRIITNSKDMAFCCLCGFEVCASAK